MSGDDVKDEAGLAERAKRVFDESVTALDGETRSKLTQARFRALEELRQGRGAAWGPRWIPAGALAAAVVAAVLVWQGQPPGSPDARAFDTAALSDLEILLGDEELDMIQELEFYAWLDEQTEPAPADGGEGGVG